MTQTMLQEKFTFTTEQAIRYLNIYVGESDWERHLRRLYLEIVKGDKDLYIQKIAFAILLGSYDGTQSKGAPESLLFGGSSKWGQWNQQDWVRLLQNTVQNDAEIESWRNQALSLGIIYPIDYSPVTRQAFNRLFDMAERTGEITPESKIDTTHRFQNIVLAYGGNVVCYVFQKEAHKLNKVLNWRTGYFFERIIFEVFSIEQVLKIKKAELAKTNPKLVRRITQN